MVGRWTCDLQVAGSIHARWLSRNIGQLSLASLRGRKIEYSLRLGLKAGFSPLSGGRWDGRRSVHGITVQINRFALIVDHRATNDYSNIRIFVY